MKDIEIFEHTADVGIRLARATREELFRDAAAGMFQIIAPGNNFVPHINYAVEAAGANNEELLVNWLSELNFYFQTEQYVPVEIEFDMAEHQLVARIKGDKIDRQRHAVEIEIKAVTYHKINVTMKNGLWQAQVIFDI